MGRPLNKKYFGNTNEGVVTSLDNGIGGEGVASVTITDPGNYNAELPTVEFPAPSLPGGVQATGTVHGELVQVYSFAANGNGYSMGNTLTVVGGSNTSVATATVTGVITVGTPFMTDDGTDYDTGDLIDFGGAGWSSNLIISVDTAVAGNITAYSVSQAGYWTGPGAAPSNLTATTSNTKMGPGSIDTNGTGAKFNLYWGVRAASVASAGDYLTVPSNPATVTGGGSGATANLRWGVKSVAMTENGSGYVSVADASPDFSDPVVAGTGTGVATGDAVLEVSQQNALLGVDLSTGDFVDIVKQESSTTFWVNTGSEVKLLTLTDSTQSLGLYLEATDSASGTYWVKNIKAHKVTLGTDGGTGTQFSENETTSWTFDAPVAGMSVKVRNAA